MDVKRAIELIKEQIGNFEYDLENPDIPIPIKISVMGDIEAMKVAVESMRLRDALPPSFEGDGYAEGGMIYDTWFCPNCGEGYEVDGQKYDCCPKCGQKILWEEKAEQKENHVFANKI